MNRRIALALIVLALLPASISLAQGNDPDTAVNLAIDHLGRQLGITLTRAQLSGWNWQETLWPDTSMACPQPGAAYEPTPTRGYIIILDYRGQTYELHVAPAAGVVVLCSGSAQPGPTATPTPSGPAAPAAPSTPTGSATLSPASDPETLINLAVRFLSAQLGATITRADLSDWGWSEIIWTDASLGCPQPGQVYAQVMTRGYMVTMELLGTTYEVRITATGDSAVLCERPLSGTAPTSPPNTTPAQRYPPETLTDIVLAYLSEQLGVAITRENARWTWEAQNWPDAALGCPVEGRVYEPVESAGYAFSVQYLGEVYQVHVAITGARMIVPCNAVGTFLQPMELPSLDEYAMTANVPAGLFVYTGADGEVYLAGVDRMPGQAITAGVTVTLTEDTLSFLQYDHLYGYYRWSPDGTQIAFLDSQEHRLLATDVQGSVPVVLAENLALLYPPTWSPDGTEIAYVTPTDAMNNNNQVMAIYAIPAPINGETGEPRLVATFEQGVGCGGGSLDPSDALRERQVGYMGNALTFTWLNDGNILFSNHCSGLGLSRLDLMTGVTTVISPDIARVALSPDQSRIAGIVFDANRQRTSLVVVDLSSGASQTLALDFLPDQVIWAADGASLYTSSRTLIEWVGDLTSGGPAAGEYDVRLWQVDLATGAAQTLAQYTAHSIGTLTAAPGGTGLIYTVIGSARDTVMGLGNGQIIPPITRLYFLDSAGQITELGEGSYPAFQPEISGEVG